jgi:hypothetical protein
MSELGHERRFCDVCARPLYPPYSRDSGHPKSAASGMPDVLAHHTGTVKIEHTLRPFAVFMAGADMFDPFKD